MTKPTRPQAAPLAAAATGADGLGPQRNLKTIASLTKKGPMLSKPVEGAAPQLLITKPGREAGARTGRISTRAATVKEPKVGPANGGERPALAADAQPKPKGKIATLVELLRRPGGASLEGMMAATGWQAHSVRGALSGTIKKNLGLAVESDKTPAGRFYRIVEAA